MDLPPSALSSMLVQAALSAGLSPTDIPPSVLSSLFSSSPFSPMFPPPPFPPSMIPPGVPSPAFSSFLSSSGMPPSGFPSLFPPSAMMPPGLPPPGFSSLLSPMNPYFNTESYMGDSSTPILVDFPPLQYGQGRQQASRYYPLTRSATEKV